MGCHCLTPYLEYFNSFSVNTQFNSSISNLHYFQRLPNLSFFPFLSMVYFGGTESLMSVFSTLSQHFA